MRFLKEITPGFIIVLSVTMISYMLSLLHPLLDSLVISIIFGMLFANLVKNEELFDRGIALTLKIFLPAGIALYGTQIRFAGAEPKMWVYVIATFLALFILTYCISRVLGLTKTLGLLLSTGVSVCGASAIAVISPVIKAKKEEISISVISVMMLGLAGMIFYPLITEFLVLNKNEFAFLSGATLPMLGQVKASASTAGPEPLAAALKLKLIRMSCLIFLPFAALMLTGEGKKLYVPWFMLVFIVLAITVNLTRAAASITELTEPLSKFLLSSSLAAIGLTVDFNSISEEGIKPLIAVFLSWGIVILLIYLTFSVTNV